jgi:YesN/AraC family two-component response regulator
MHYLIKNIGGDSCKSEVIQELENFNINFSFSEPGEVHIVEKIPADTRTQLKDALQKRGLEFIDNKSIILTEKIKSIVIQLVHHSNEWPATNFSVFLTGKLGYNYTYLANLFSEYEGNTIARYIMAQKVEKVKQMMVTQGFNLKQIASLMQYSSVAHLSTQFKKITGYNPSHFKKIEARRRNAIEAV